MRWKIVLLLAIGISLCSGTLWACHKGGPMGFATNDPGGFSLDITLSQLLPVQVHKVHLVVKTGITPSINGFNIWKLSGHF